MKKQYDPQKTEGKIYQQWEKSGYFNPDNLKLSKGAKPFTIVLPPPNITDRLHLGHSSTLAIEDLLIRFHRMRGYHALWIPGTDHAAIATQNVVEKKLLKEKGLTRHDLGKEKFLRHVWKFLRETQATIFEQTRKMGASLDWSREAFTLDGPRQKAVKKMFIQMYQEGIIYRGERIVNWCPRCQSTLADDEIDYRPQRTTLYNFRYAKNFPISIATTRPETKLGDTAVAVNPKDKRYKKFIGKIFNVNFLGMPLQISITADPKVELNFGTGALGVTPAHSMTDWNMASKNNLKIIKVIDERGKIKKGFGKFSDKTISEARRMIIEKLKEKKLLESEEEIEHNLGTCYRCDAIIEQLPSKQWFVAVDKKIKRLGNKSLKEKAVEVAKKEQIRFIPDRFAKRYLDWMANLYDWCISRQVWFGHQIPVWYCETNLKSKNEQVKSAGGKQKTSKKCQEPVVSEEEVKKCPYCGGKVRQDSDTLDTWFSSGMWTFSTMGWPDTFKSGKKTGDLARFHPTQVLETGYEIITLWVSRMIMMSLFAVGEIPFENVYLHGMILDKRGKKMSKSRGNGIDPLDVAQKFGTDAVRLSLLIGNTPGNDMRIFEEKIASFRNFANKLWNIARYATVSYASFKLVESIKKEDVKSLADKWIVNRLNEITKTVTRHIENYQFSLAGEALKNFTWNELADWYVEANKIEKNKKLLGYVLNNVLKLWHPFMPFVTEEIYQNISKRKGLLMVAAWPQPAALDSRDGKEFEAIKNIITAIRNIRAVYKIDPQKMLKISVTSGNASLIKNELTLLKKLARVQSILTGPQKKNIPGSASAIIESYTIAVHLAGVIDMKKEKERLGREIERLSLYQTAQEKKLQNKNFVRKAPSHIVSQEQEKSKHAGEKIRELKKHVANLY